MDVDDLTEAERIDLMRFLCSFAWADGEVQPKERAVLDRVLAGLQLSDEGHAQVRAWLSAPPDMEGFDFGAIAPDKRSLFTDHAFEVAAADGGLAAEELAHLQMFMRFSDG
jgi:uncharacterized tellurite resistance protein B-like protein